MAARIHVSWRQTYLLVVRHRFFTVKLVEAHIASGQRVFFVVINPHVVFELVDAPERVVTVLAVVKHNFLTFWFPHLLQQRFLAIFIESFKRVFVLHMMPQPRLVLESFGARHTDEFVRF